MVWGGKAIFGRSAAAGLLALAVLAAPAPSIAEERALFVSLGEATHAPIGWIEFCEENPRECSNRTTTPRDIVLTAQAWKDLVRVNLWANSHIKPMTDLEHYGVVEKWAYPDDGMATVENYVLLKRRMLMQAGWPREALLITVVRDKNSDGHAVLYRQNRQRGVRPRQPDRRDLAVVGHRLSLRQAPVAGQPQCMDLARRSASGAGNGDLALNFRSSRPRSRPHPSPSPDRVRARPALPQEPAAPILNSQKSAQILNFSLRPIRLSTQRNAKTTFRVRGKSVESVRNSFPVRGG